MESVLAACLLGVGLFLVFRSRSSNSLYKQNLDLLQVAIELNRETIKLQTEANGLMRELVDALRAKS